MDIAVDRIEPGCPGAPAGNVVAEPALDARTRRGYYLFVPSSYDGQSPFRLLVVIHGHRRHVEASVEPFIELAAERRWIILAPYFPPPERFQQLGIGDSAIRADLLLLQLVGDVRRAFRVDTATFDLFGFSAGAQFAHRFLYLHPERLRSVVVASPGTVTLPIAGYSWPHGLAGLDMLADAQVNLDHVRHTRVLLVVGTGDVGNGNLNHSAEADRSGQTRLERVRVLHQAWLAARIAHQYVEIPALSHVLDDRIGAVARGFLAEAD